MGFAFTFVIGIAWGVLRYEPRQFATHEAFLILFFAIYVAIPIVNGLRREPARRDPVDGTLVFGNPLLSFGLQAGLLEAAPDAAGLVGAGTGAAVCPARLVAAAPRARAGRILRGAGRGIRHAGRATGAVGLGHRLRVRAGRCRAAVAGIPPAAAPAALERPRPAGAGGAGLPVLGIQWSGGNSGLPQWQLPECAVDRHRGVRECVAVAAAAGSASAAAVLLGPGVVVRRRLARDRSLRAAGLACTRPRWLSSR